MRILITEIDNIKLSREDAKHRQLVAEHGKGNRPQAACDLTEAKEKKLFECGKSDSLLIAELERAKRAAKPHT